MVRLRIAGGWGRVKGVCTCRCSLRGPPVFGIPVAQRGTPPAVVAEGAAVLGLLWAAVGAQCAAVLQVADALAVAVGGGRDHGEVDCSSG